jgi:hypothetical protein
MIWKIVPRLSPRLDLCGPALSKDAVLQGLGVSDGIRTRDRLDHN